MKRTLATKDTAMTALERESDIMKTKLTDTATETRAALTAKDLQIAAHVARSAEVAIYEPLEAWVTVPGPDPATDITWGALKGAFHCRVCQVAWPPRGVPSPSQVDIMAALSLAGWRGRNGIPQPVDDRFTTIDHVEILDNPGTARRFALAHHSMARNASSEVCHRPCPAGTHVPSLPAVQGCPRPTFGNHRPCQKR